MPHPDKPMKQEKGDTFSFLRPQNNKAMEFSSGDRDRPYHHHRRGDDDEPERRRRTHDDDGEPYPPPRRDEQRYPTQEHQPYPPPGRSDPFRREDQGYPFQESGGGSLYDEEIDRRPHPRPTSGYVQDVAPQMFDERPHATSGYAQHVGPQVFDERPYATSRYAQHVGPQVFDERPHATSGYAQHVAPQVLDERPQVTHVAHQVFEERPYATSGYVQHVAHQTPVERPNGSGGYGGGDEMGRVDPYGGRTASSHHVKGDDGVVSGMKTVRVFTKAAEGYSLSIRDGEVVLLRSDSSDERQHWFKDEKYNVKVKDEEGLPSFALVNKATGQAIKHSIGATQPVRLVPYDPDRLDVSVLWSESGDTGGNFHAIRMVNNIRLNFDAFHGDKDHGGVRDGTTVVLWEWLQGDNQQWKIAPYCKLSIPVRSQLESIFDLKNQNIFMR